jgi:SH3 domain protein
MNQFWRSRSEEAGAELADVRSASAEALQTRAENENLRRRVAELTAATEVANMQIDELSRRERQNWFIIGAAVLFAGIVIGLVAPTLRRKRRSSW